MFRTILFAAVTLWLTVACSSSPSRSDIYVALPATAEGPPAHAPAHGYRNKHRHKGIDLVFDTGLGVYVVVNMEGYFFNNGLFYRYRDHSWEISVDIDRGWKIVSANKVPRGLLVTGHGTGNGKSKGKKNKA